MSNDILDAREDSGLKEIQGHWNKIFYIKLDLLPIRMAHTFIKDLETNHKNI